MKINTKSMLYGTIILSMANFIVRLLGFVYRVFLSRTIGSQGMGLVQLVYPVFYIGIALTTTGIPIAVSRLISEKKVKNDYHGMRFTMTIAITLVTIISVTLTLAALLNLNFISKVIIKDERTKGALFVLLPCIIIIGIGATLKGFFYGQKDIHPPALAEIIEQITRMAVAIGLILWLVPGEDFALSAILVMFGSVMGELSSLLFLHINYNRARKRLKIAYSSSRNLYDNHLSKIYGIKKAAGAITAIALPITVTRLINSLMSSANAILIPQRLMAGGLIKEQAVDMLGIFSGMVMPLMFLPFTITNALTVVIIPNLSESKVMNKWKDIQGKISKAIKLTLLIAFPSTALLASLGNPIGDLLYRHPMVGVFLIPISYTLPLHALQHTSSGILNGLGKQNQAAFHYMGGSLIQLMCTWFLAANPAIRIWGVVIGFTLSSLMVCSANIITLLKTAKMSFRFTEWILKPGTAAFLMGFSSSMVYNILSSRKVPVLLSLIASAGAGFILFFLSLWALKSIPAPETWHKRLIQ